MDSEEPPPLGAPEPRRGPFRAHRGPRLPQHPDDPRDARASTANLDRHAEENATDCRERNEALARTNAELARAYDATIEGWSHALDLRDKETEGHSKRVTELTLRLALVLGVPDSELVHIRRGALLHDIGKIGIPDRILLKPSTLTDEEMAVMRRHPVYAYELLAPIEYLRPALDIPYCHHERWDGTGYPRGLRGDEIPLAARIFAVADVWDAFRSDRPYRPAWSEDQARRFIADQAGRHFDPHVVEAFLRTIGEGSRLLPAASLQERRA